MRAVPQNNQIAADGAGAMERRSWSGCSPDPGTMEPKRGVFLDLNGTLVEPVLVERLQDLKVIDGAPEAIARLCRAGFVCPVVTVQSRIEKGLFSEGQFREWFSGLAEHVATRGGSLVGPYVCPHRFSTVCACAKPQTLLYERAALEHGISLADSFVVGDTAADVEAADRFGGRGCLLKSGLAGGAADAAAGRLFACCTARTLGEITDWILGQGLASNE